MSKNAKYGQIFRTTTYSGRFGYQSLETSHTHQQGKNPSRNELRTSLKVIFPAAISGISSSYILGISRAIGETMIVAVAAGQKPNLTLNPFEQGATITAFIAQASLGDLPHGTLEYKTIFAAGLTLVLMTLLLNIVGHFLAKKYREIY